jgi:hypothetical protein
MKTPSHTSAHPSQISISSTKTPNISRQRQGHFKFTTKNPKCIFNRKSPLKTTSPSPPKTIKTPKRPLPYIAKSWNSRINFTASVTNAGYLPSTTCSACTASRKWPPKPCKSTRR